jgi:hypothetical protein
MYTSETHYPSATPYQVLHVYTTIPACRGLFCHYFGISLIFVVFFFFFNLVPTKFLIGQDSVYVYYRCFL